MMTIKRFDVLSAGCMWAILSVAMGLIVGILYAIFLSIFFAIAGNMSSELSGFGGLGIGLVWLICVIGFPIIYGIFGFVGGIIGAALYNVFARWIGGIKVELTTPVDAGF